MFRFFRRYQKTLIVVAGVFCMLAFIVADPLAQMLSSGGGGGGRDLDEVAVKWDGGQLTRGELGKLMQSRRIAANFMGSIYQLGHELAPEGVPDLVTPFISNPNAREFPEDTVQTHILANEARRMGMTITDDTIAKYLAELGLNQVGQSDMRGIIEALSSQGQGRISVNYLFDAVREEMLAGLLRSSYRYAVSAEMPQERYREWLEANDEIFIEAVGIPVTESLVDVGEPTEEELKKLFDEYKDAYPRPVFLPGGVELPQPKPAFGIPRRVTLQYLRANPEKFREQIAAEITDEAVAKFYEENKSLYLKTDFDLGGDDPAGSDPAGSDPAGSDPTGSVPAGDDPETGEPSSSETTPEGSDDEADEAESAGDESTDKPVDESTDGETPADNATTNDTSTNETEAGVPAVTEDEGEAESTDAAPSDENPPQAASRNSSPFQLAAFQQEETDESASANEESPTDDAPAGSDVAPATDVETTEIEKTDAVAESTEAQATEGELPATTLEYKPLEEVADEIRDSLANAKVAEKIAEITDKVYNQLTVDFRNYQGKVLDAEGLGKPVPVPPVSLTDLTRLAAEYGLEYEKTKPLSQFELRDDVPVGMSAEIVRTGAATAESLLVNIAFGDMFDDYEPIRSMSVDGSSYVTMRIADDPRKVPKFEDVRDEVVKAWRMQQAADIAQKRAEALATKIEQADVSLKDYFADDPNREVVEPAAFARITPGDMSPTSFMVNYRMSQPEGIEAAGPDFINKVFEAETGDVLAIENFDRSIAYIVRVKSHLKTPEKLRETFLTETDSWLGRYTMLQANRSAAQQRLFGDLFDAKNIEWQIELNEGEEQ